MIIAFSILRPLRRGLLHAFSAWLGASLAMSMAVNARAATEQVALGLSDRLLVVDCLLPGKVQRIGTRVTYLTPRRPVKTAAGDCEIRGGEYVAYDRASLDTALQVWLPMAKEGDKLAQTYVGEIYEKGIGGAPPDFGAARQWYEKAAAQGYARALMNLGYLHERGNGVPKDLTVALNYYRKASGLGNLIVADETGASQQSAEQIQTLRRELEATRRELEKAQKELEKQRGASQSELDSLKQELARARVAGDAQGTKKFEAQIRDAEAKLERQRVEVARLEKTVESYREQLKKQESETTALRTELEQSRAGQDQQTAQLRHELERTRKELESVQAQFARERAAMETELQKVRADQAKAQATGNSELARQAEARIKQYEDKLVAQHQEVTRLERSLEAYRDQLQRREAEQATQIAGLRTELAKTQEQLTAARAELDRQRGATQSEIETIKREQAKAAANGNLESAKKLEAQAKQYEDKLDQQRLQVARLEQTLDAYRTQLKQAESESAGLRQDLTQAQAQLVSLNQELDERRAKSAQDQRLADALAAELDKLRKQAASNDQREQVRKLETELKQKQDELARQKQEIGRLEQELQKKEKDAKVASTQDRANKEKSSDGMVLIAPPTIQMIDPSLVATRGPGQIKVRGAVQTREIIGRVTAPAGLFSFTVNDKSEALDDNGMFKVQVPLLKGPTPVTLVAVDKQSRRAILDFTLVSEQAYETLAKPPSAGLRGSDFGNYHALVIGNEKYQHLPKLDTAAEDARVVSDVLARKYGFKVTTLLNANRYEILSELNKLRGKLTEKDNLLIYYAGHGELDRANLRGHWLPVDAEPNSDANWISSVQLTDLLNAMSVKHVLIVADSCYSGAMTRNAIGQLDAGMSPEAKVSWLKELARARCRTVLTSGGVQPVIDGGGGKHSIFAKSFIEVLEANDEPLEGQRLYREVAARVVHFARSQNLDQKPEYAPLKYAGHESGDFLFIPKASLI